MPRAVEKIQHILCHFLWQSQKVFCTCHWLEKSSQSCKKKKYLGTSERLKNKCNGGDSDSQPFAYQDHASQIIKVWQSSDICKWFGFVYLKTTVYFFRSNSWWNSEQKKLWYAEQHPSVSSASHGFFRLYTFYNFIKGHRERKYNWPWEGFAWRSRGCAYMNHPHSWPGRQKHLEKNNVGWWRNFNDAIKSLRAFRKVSAFGSSSTDELS